ncbi:MAG: peptidylprolyl isomerase [Ferruginibacter sp.]|nr:peptidylprolyl isomerase [Ferruginibacter sp.]
MKKIYLLIALACSHAAVFSQTVFTYGPHAVSKDEFLRAYNKNNSPVTDKESSLREYLDLYSNFKLKVKAAEELRLDTLPQIQYDITNFRQQVEENYMSDEKGTNKLLDEAFIRSQKDLHVLHFSIPVPANKTDSLNTYRQIEAVYTALNSNDNNYKTIAENNAVKFGDLGFITVFSVPYEFENIIYSLKPGQVSKVYRSKKSWHVFKLAEERKSAGKWKVAQILFSYPQDAGEDVKTATLKKADSVYNLLLNGADFSRIAKELSDDKLTYMKGGEMPEFGTGKYRHEFEQEVFKLTSDNEITRPFATAYGIHIVKRIAFAATPDNRESNSLQFELKQKLMQDSRINEAKESFAKSIISLTGYKKSLQVKEAELFRYADSVTSNSLNDPEKLPLSNKTIITFSKGTVKGKDWLKYVREYKSSPEQYKGESNAAMWNRFVTYSSLEYYKKHLEDYNEDFRYQMKEFKEGNMLFEIMERNVWSKASSDTNGLKELYNSRKSTYKWAASADVIIFSCANEKLAKETLESIKKGNSWKAITENADGSVQADSGRYEMTQITDPASGINPVNNSYSSLLKNADGTATFVKYITVYPAGQQRSFEEARGLVINDYQNVLETQWLELLRKKYPVKINEVVVKQILN